MRKYVRLTEMAASDLRACERLRKSRPRQALRHLHRAAARIGKADILRGHTFCGLVDASAAVQCSTPDEKSRAESAVIQVFWETFRNSLRTDLVMQRLQQALAQAALAEAEREERPPVTLAMQAVLRRFLRHRAPSARDRILALWKRRQRSKAAAPEDAPRKLSRGRAPPLLSICAL